MMRKAQAILASCVTHEKAENGNPTLSAVEERIFIHILTPLAVVAAHSASNGAYSHGLGASFRLCAWALRGARGSIF